MRHVEPVQVERSREDETVYRHPAFGQISLHRVSGRRALYGSDFEHNGYISIEINTSELHRGLSHDWPHQRKELIEVHLSEAQWATFVSSMSQGSGVQCTIACRHDMGLVPTFELPSKREMFDNEMKEKLRKTVTRFRETMDQIDSMGLPKSKAAALKEPFSRAIQEMEANVPFVAESFEKHMEKTVEKAKVEIHGYMNHTLHSIGLDAIQQQIAAPLVIEDQTEK